MCCKCVYTVGVGVFFISGDFGVAGKNIKQAYNGIGENGSFYRSHPLINFIYFTVIITVTMFSNHPVYLAVSFAVAWIYSVLLNGKKALKFNTLILVPVIVLTVILNALNVRNGVTVLFYLNGNGITLEAIIFGLVQGLMLTSVIIWFSIFNVIVTEDKFIYLFGRFSPVIALTLSMVLRFVPLLKNRYREISAAQRSMGRGASSAGIFARIRQLGKKISILIAWSLEAAIESADSMEARGYGLRGRTSFHLYRMKRSEFWLLAVFIILGLLCILACIMDYTNIYYYPSIVISDVSPRWVISAAAFCIMMICPVVQDIRGMRIWK